MKLQKIFLTALLCTGIISILVLVPTRHISQVSPEKNWKTFENKTDGYSIGYPPNLVPYKSGNYLYFRDNENGPSYITVMVWGEDTVPKALLDDDNKKIEKSIHYNNYDGVITHPISTHENIREEFPYEKTLSIQKYNKFYFINSRGIDFDHEKLWRGFRLSSSSSQE